jgi:hypothetical protein
MCGLYYWEINSRKCIRPACVMRKDILPVLSAILYQYNFLLLILPRPENLTLHDAMHIALANNGVRFATRSQHKRNRDV